MILKILLCWNSFFKFVKLCIAPCDAVNLDCILKVRDFQFMFCLQIHAVAGHTMNSKLLKFFVPCVARKCVYL